MLENDTKIYKIFLVSIHEGRGTIDFGLDGAEKSTILSLLKRWRACDVQRDMKHCAIFECFLIVHSLQFKFILMRLLNFA